MISVTFSEIARWLPSTEFYSGMPFWGYFAVVVIAIRAAPERGSARGLLLLVANALMLLALPHFNGWALLVYGGLAIFTYGIGHILNNRALPKPGNRLALAILGVSAVVAVLAFFKYRMVQGLLIKDGAVLGSSAAGFVFLIGISYSSFKAIHFIIESYKVNIKNPGFLDFLNYLLFFPSFVSGPINRYNDFYENSDQAKGSRMRGDFSAGLERIIHGLFKKFVITVILFPYTLVHMKTPLGELQWWQVLLGLYAYALYFYFDFSGYTDLAIGSARLLGFKLPENFNRPFLKKNIQQLWANWHMSLTGWLTDYVYWPLVRRMRNSELRKHPLVISNIAIIITFFLCGAWHGEGINFILWGLYHGIGIAVVNGYQKFKRQTRHALILKYFASPWSYSVGVILSFNFFALGLLFLLDSRQREVVLGRLF